MDWEEQFQPITDTGWNVRKGQEQLGNAIIYTLDHPEKPLVGQASTGTGKSISSVLPLIYKIKEAKKLGKTYRAVISTETITLQRQLEKKDLPFLKSIYKDIDFTYHKLLGRSNYLCFDRAFEESVGNPNLSRLVERLEGAKMRLTSGEREDVEQVLNTTIDTETWSRISGERTYCADNTCTPDTCYASLSREKALSADIVIVNHMILAIDFEMKNSLLESEGMVGMIDAIIVDEAHKLEEVLISQWSEKFTIYEIEDHVNRLVEGANVSQSAGRNMQGIASKAEDIEKSVLGFFKLTQKFFTSIEKSYKREWKGSEIALKTQFIRNPSNLVRDLMNEFETSGQASLEVSLRYLEDIVKRLSQLIAKDSLELDKRSLKVIKKSLTSAKYLESLVSLCLKSMLSEKGMVSYRGMSYGVVVEGWENRKGEEKMTIRAFPLDVSNRAKDLWKVSCVFLSATLIDLTRDDFAYFKKSLGINDSNDIRVESTFDMDQQQLVYITAQNYDKEEGTQFSVSELVDIVNQAQGRSLILFTSRKDLNMTKNMLLGYKTTGQFPYPMFVQEQDSDKAKLVDQFKSDTNSVLLGLKSMFTGIDIPGESLSLVVLCKFPLDRFSTECKMRIDHWRSKGFPEWYSRSSLTVFQQAAGRLIRSDDCKGVVALLDQRAYDPKTNVFKTASIGVSSLQSRVTHDPKDISRHLGVLSEV